MIIFLAVTAFFIFAYHFLRNGIPWKDYGTLVSRLIWGICFSIGYDLTLLPHTSIWAGAMFSATAFLSMLVPHAFCQNMGRWATPQKQWPAFFLSTKTQAEWDAMSAFEKTRYDFFGMLGVGAFRALIVYGFTTAVLIFTGDATFLAVPAALVAAVAQPVAYLIGKYVPFGIWATPARSPGWGEIFVAIGWAASLAVYAGFSILV